MVLICSACIEEHKFLKSSNLSENFQYLELGLGYLNAAINLDRYLNKLKKKPEKIIFLGTAGVFESLKIADLVCVKNVSLLLSASRMNLAYSPIKKEDLTISSSLSKEFENIKKVRCFSSLDISLSKFLYLELKKDFPDEILVENMELFGLAKVSDDHKIPWEAYLGISNFIGARAHQEWKETNEIVSEKLNKWFLEKYIK